MRESILAPVLVTALIFNTVPVVAQEAAPAAEPASGSDVLVIGTKVAPPFAIRQEDGSWRGIAIELWDEVAEQLGYDYRLQEATLEELISGLEDGSFDASVAALTMTAERERRIDFSHGFHSSGLGIAVPAVGEGGSQWMRALRNLIDPRFLGAVASLVVVLFVAGLLVWIFERRRNPDQFEPGARGLGSAFWWSAVTMTTVGYGDKASVSAGGRVVALLWMFISVIVISSFTAAIASSLTVAQLDTGIRGPDDLAQALTATVTGSTSSAYLADRHLRHEELATAQEGLSVVAAGDADAMVYDEPILRYLVRTSGERLTVLPETFERQDYAIGLPEGSELREPVNRVLLEVIDRPAWQETLERYLGQE
jgi:ABC-type amino acid transport substrate-binding protein